MNAIINALKAILKLALLAFFALAALVGLFVAWWLVVFAVLGFAVYFAVRRFFGAGARQSKRAVVIEGEYAVERDEERPRALDSKADRPETAPKNRLD